MKTSVQPAKVIGKGGFGLVTDEGKVARKHFKKPEHLVRELVMLRYMRSSPYVVKIKTHNFESLTICCEKWSCSLRDALIRYDISAKHKLKILKHTLYGLCHMHAVDLVHSDVTLSNIFVNVKTWDACLGDLGLSSITEYSRVKQTAEGYAPVNPVPCQGHDMFGLAVCMFTLFSYTKIYQKKTAAELRQLIQDASSIPSGLKSVLKAMCPDNPHKAISPQAVLKKLFQETTSFSLPDIDIYKVVPDNQERKFIFEQIKLLTNTYEVNRANHCYHALIQFLSGPSGTSVTPEYFDLYIVASVYIYACLYGKSHYNLEEAMKSFNQPYTSEYFFLAVQALIQDTNFVALSVVSK